MARYYQSVSPNGNELTREVRWHSPWLGGGLFFAWSVAFVGILLVDWRGVAAAAPILMVSAYGIACLLLNKERIRVTPEGVEVRGVPLPGGVIARRVSSAEIRTCYFRFVPMQPKSGIDPYWAAGVETAGGPWIDVVAPLRSREEAMEAANRIAMILGKAGASEAAGGQPRDWKLARRVLAWGGAFIASFLWLGFLEATR